MQEKLENHTLSDHEKSPLGTTIPMLHQHFLELNKFIQIYSLCIYK